MIPRPGLRQLALVPLAAVAMFALQACGETTKTLSEEETKRILRQELPYRFEFRPVAVPEHAEGSVGGRVFGPHGTVVRFGVSLGPDGEPVSLGPTTDLANATGGETFRVTRDTMELIDGRLEVGRNIETDAQWRTAATMTVEIETALCEATEGEPCGI